jgi:soluble lytic murein transglycosylase-like protein
MLNTCSAHHRSRPGAARASLRIGSALCVLLALTSCKPADAPIAAGPASSVAISPQDVALLFAATSAAGGPHDVDSILEQARAASRTDPLWPMLTYLTGEAHLKRNDVERARSAFRELSAWAVAERGAGPYQDGKGGSGLAVIGLWRWLRILDQHGGSAEEVGQALEVAASLQQTALFDGMVNGGLLPALPLVEEDIARRLARVAAAAGRREALDLFLDFMSVDTTGVYDESDQRLRERMLDEEVATPERLDLYQLRRQVSRIKLAERKRESAVKLRQLWENQFAPTEVRAEAGYEWGNYHRGSDDKKPDVIAALSSAYELAAGRGSVAERSLYLRGMVHNRGATRNADAFFADMQRLLERHPKGRMADDALYQVATEHLFGARRDVDRAFSYFERLRAYDGPNDYLDSAYVLPAIGMVERGAEADLPAAERLLADYVEQFPDGPFRLRSLFWRARIAEQRGDTGNARRLFEQLVTEAPYDYYGLRARLHREYGTRANAMVLPPSESATAAELRAAYHSSVPDTVPARTTPYHQRLRAMEHNGLYVQLRSVVDGLGRRFRNRVDSIDLDDLDRNDLIPAVAVLLALRQDALAARDADATPENQLQLAAFIGRKLGDWPLAISMADLHASAAHARRGALQNDPRYLATVYPAGDALQVLREPLARSAWKIDGSTALSRSLMYAVIRRESLYYPSAISLVGAIGLFQVMPATFEGRKDCWQTRGPDERPTPANYLFDPDRNAQFWSCWVGKEFQPRTRNSIATMLVKHHAGTGNYVSWQRSWKGRATENDVELQIETFRFPATRLFVQRVLNDVAIVDASGLIETAPGGDGRQKP